LGQGRAIGEIRQLLLDPVSVQLVGDVAANARTDRRRRDALGRSSQGAGVQDLHHDLDVGVGGMDRRGHQPMLLGLFLSRKLGPSAGFLIGRDAAGDDHADPTAGPFGKERGLPLETARHVLQTRMHRPH
jgi:hypothetical protein